MITNIRLEATPQDPVIRKRRRSALGVGKFALSKYTSNVIITIIVHNMLNYLSCTQFKD